MIKANKKTIEANELSHYLDYLEAINQALNIFLALKEIKENQTREKLVLYILSGVLFASVLLLILALTQL